MAKAGDVSKGHSSALKLATHVKHQEYLESSSWKRKAVYL
jgi:hypothetical protein